MIKEAGVGPFNKIRLPQRDGPILQNITASTAGETVFMCLERNKFDVNS